MIAWRTTTRIRRMIGCEKCARDKSVVVRKLRPRKVCQCYRTDLELRLGRRVIEGEVRNLRTVARGRVLTAVDRLVAQSHKAKTLGREETDVDLVRERGKVVSRVAEIRAEKTVTGPRSANPAPISCVGTSSRGIVCAETNVGFHMPSRFQVR